MQKTVSRRAYIADGENDLSGGIAAAEILWCAGASQVI